MVCAFTGHRPHRLPWGSNEEDPGCLALKQKIAQTVDIAADRGCTTFLCGMARGCDTYFAEAVLRRAETSGVELVAMIPCPDQSDGWALKDRQRYEEILLRCGSVEVLAPEYTPDCMLRRNRAMVERSQLLISVYDGGRGGTARTVRYAAELGVEILPVWL